MGIADHSRGGVVLQDCLGGGLKDEIYLEISKYHYGRGDDILKDDAGEGESQVENRKWPILNFIKR